MSPLSKTYTFIMDYLGGTYISQVSAISNQEAMRKWIFNLKTEEIKGFTDADKSKLISDDFIYEVPALIADTINVWCITVQTKKGFGLVNFVKTDTVPE